MTADPRLLSVDGWKASKTRLKLKDKDLADKDKELVKVLLALKSTAEEDFEGRGKAMGKIASLAAELKNDEELAEFPGFEKHMSDMVSAAHAEQREITKSKTGAQLAAGKSLKAGAVNLRKRGADEDDDELDDDDDDDADEDERDVKKLRTKYETKLKDALLGLATASKPYHFVVCVVQGNPKLPCLVAISRDGIQNQHKRTLTRLSGSTKFLKRGTLRREDNTLFLDMKPSQKGWTWKIRRSLEIFAHKKFSIVIGDEVADADAPEPEGLPDAGDELETEVGAAAPEETQPRAKSDAAKPALEKAPEVWTLTQRVVKSKIGQLKAAVRQAFAAEGPDLVADIEQNMKKLDLIFEKLDDDLAELLESANAAQDSATRTAQLKKAKALLVEHITFVKSEPMIAHVDSNPFGVTTNLQETLTKSLRHVVQAIGE